MSFLKRERISFVAKSVSCEPILISACADVWGECRLLATKCLRMKREWISRLCNILVRQKQNCMITLSKNSARATKWAALALKARAAIYAGSIANYNNKMENPVSTPGSEVGIPASKASEYYKIAYDAAKAVIDGGVYVLQNNISDKADNFYAATTLSGLDS